MRQSHFGSRSSRELRSRDGGDIDLMKLFARQRWEADGEPCRITCAYSLRFRHGYG